MFITRHATKEYSTSPHAKEKTTTQEIKCYSELSQNQMFFFLVK